MSHLTNKTYIVFSPEVISKVPFPEGTMVHKSNLWSLLMDLFDAGKKRKTSNSYKDRAIVWCELKIFFNADHRQEFKNENDLTDALVDTYKKSDTFSGGFLEVGKTKVLNQLKEWGLTEGIDYILTENYREVVLIEASYFVDQKLQKVNL